MSLFILVTKHYLVVYVSNKFLSICTALTGSSSPDKPSKGMRMRSAP